MPARRRGEPGREDDAIRNATRVGCQAPTEFSPYPTIKKLASAAPHTAGAACIRNSVPVVVETADKPDDDTFPESISLADRFARLHPDGNASGQQPVRVHDDSIRDDALWIPGALARRARHDDDPIGASRLTRSNTETIHDHPLTGAQWRVAQTSEPFHSSSSGMPVNRETATPAQLFRLWRW
ncbi:MAG: hypothetical protein IPF82_23305 [Blastocatellia bacterium]|nr:hypothetical protein [Blastocatellia bacterium]